MPLSLLSVVPSSVPVIVPPHLAATHSSSVWLLHLHLSSCRRLLSRTSCRAPLVLWLVLAFRCTACPRWQQWQHCCCLCVPLVLFWLLPLVHLLLQCLPPIGGNGRIAIVLVPLSSPLEGRHHHNASSQDGNCPHLLLIASSCPLALVFSRHQPSLLPLMVGCCILCPLHCCHPFLSLIVLYCVIIDMPFTSRQPPAISCLLP
jgi:hypothetical protein